MRVSREWLESAKLTNVRGGIYTRSCSADLPCVRIAAQDEEDKDILMLIAKHMNKPVEVRTDDEGIVVEYYVNLPFSPENIRPWANEKLGIIRGG